MRPDFHIGNNGNVIADKDRKLIYLSDFSNELAREVVDYFEQNLSDKIYFISANNGYSFGRRIFNEGSGFLEDHLDKIEDYLDHPVNTMFAQAMVKEDTKEITDLLNEYFDGRLTFYNNDPYIDIVEHINDKATALKFLVENYNIPEEDIYTIGDNFNDVTMIENFNGYVVSHASEFIKKHAKGEFETVADMINTLLK